MPPEIRELCIWMCAPTAVCLVWLLLRNLYGPRDSG